ncbi:hypothetical protein J6590_092608 [Homalodisca vitripennis]|nr:hypothetical protein J6590_092608 [Homalodisca vitripennis]
MCENFRDRSSDLRELVQEPVSSDEEENSDFDVGSVMMCVIGAEHNTHSEVDDVGLPHIGFTEADRPSSPPRPQDEPGPSLVYLMYQEPPCGCLFIPLSRNNRQYFL